MGIDVLAHIGIGQLDPVRTHVLRQRPESFELIEALRRGWLELDEPLAIDPVIRETKQCVSGTGDCKRLLEFDSEIDQLQVVEFIGLEIVGHLRVAGSPAQEGHVEHGGSAVANAQGALGLQRGLDAGHPGEFRFGQGTAEASRWSRRRVLAEQRRSGQISDIGAAIEIVRRTLVLRGGAEEQPGLAGNGIRPLAAGRPLGELEPVAFIQGSEGAPQAGLGIGIPVAAGIGCLLQTGQLLQAGNQVLLRFREERALRRAVIDPQIVPVEQFVRGLLGSRHDRFVVVFARPPVAQPLVQFAQRAEVLGALGSGRQVRRSLAEFFQRVGLSKPPRHPLARIGIVHALLGGRG